MKSIATSILAAFILFVTGCKTQQPLNRTAPFSNEIRYSAIYLIHADANYLYHNEDGDALKADEKVLAEAMKVGEKAISGEVFIYHLKPEKKILWLFPRKDRRVLHYRNGELIADRLYSPMQDSLLFKAESDFYAQNRVSSASRPEKVLLYFGHEIPVSDGAGYHRTLPEIPVNADNFSKSIQLFLTNAQETFALTVLSTCNNGSPQMAQLLSPYSGFLLASPQNLHLSHIDSKDLTLFEDEDQDLKNIATQLAENTFQRMSTSLQTAVTLSLYDLKEVNEYMTDYYDLYQAYLTENKIRENRENVDCSQLDIFKEMKNHRGVSRWYKPPQFGRNAEASVHSGWGCKEGTGEKNSELADIE